MSVPIIAFFNNKGGVGKTSLVYHLSWTYADLGLRVVAADLDPQSNLTSAFLDEDKLEVLWPDNIHSKTVAGFINPLLQGTGDIAKKPHLEIVTENLGLVVGDLALSGFEDELSQQWPQCADGKERAFRVISAFYRILQAAASKHSADITLMDLGPNLGAINRAALISADYVIIPLAPDLFSLQGLRNLGPTLRKWRSEWDERLKKNPISDLNLPAGRVEPIGYIILQHSVRFDRPVQAYDRWISKIPAKYREDVRGERNTIIPAVSDDIYCLSLLKHYRSLVPLAMEARKPIFHLQYADGARGSHLKAVENAKKDFDILAKEIAKRIGIEIGVPHIV